MGSLTTAVTYLQKCISKELTFWAFISYRGYWEWCRIVWEDQELKTRNTEVPAYCSDLWNESGTAQWELHVSAANLDMPLLRKAGELPAVPSLNTSSAAFDECSTAGDSRALPAPPKGISHTAQPAMLCLFGLTGNILLNISYNTAGSATFSDLNGKD